MMNSLEGKSILFFCPRFFGYEVEIFMKLKEMRANVDYFDERPSNDFISKASIRLNKQLIRRKLRQYYGNILKKTEKKQYDYVFVVNIEAMLPSILEELKRQQKKSIFILYMWDSIKNKKNTLSLIPYFDHISSFDKADALNIPRVSFRPLFFTDRFGRLYNEKVSEWTDLCFIGTVHSDRYNLICKIKEQINTMDLKSYFFMYFPSPVLFFYKKLKDNGFFSARFNEFSFKSLSLDTIVMHIRSSKVILDIQHPLQSGLTMRTMEAVGSGKKLITTNPHIVEYDFYDPQNILIIDRNNPAIDRGFFETDYKTLNDHIRFKYSIQGWIEDLF